METQLKEIRAICGGPTEARPKPVLRVDRVALRLNQARTPAHRALSRGTEERVRIHGSRPVENRGWEIRNGPGGHHRPIAATAYRTQPRVAEARDERSPLRQHAEPAAIPAVVTGGRAGVNRFEERGRYCVPTSAEDSHEAEQTCSADRPRTTHGVLLRIDAQCISPIFTLRGGRGDVTLAADSAAPRLRYHLLIPNMAGRQGKARSNIASYLYWFSNFCMFTVPRFVRRVPTPPPCRNRAS